MKTASDFSTKQPQNLLMHKRWASFTFFLGGSTFTKKGGVGFEATALEQLCGTWVFGAFGSVRVQTPPRQSEVTYAPTDSVVDLRLT